MEKLTLSKACKLIGKNDKMGSEVIRLEYERAIKDKPWLTINDWLWGKLQKMILDTNGAAEIYWMMAKYVSKFEGKSGLQYDQLAIKTRLKNDFLGLHSERIEWVAEVIGDLKCNHGGKMDRKQFAIEENFNPAELAGKKCERLNCQCMYSIVAKRNQDERIIWKK